MRKIFLNLFLTIFILPYLSAVDHVYTHLTNSGYNIEELIPLSTKGATDCKYYILIANRNKYFIKTGEKVDREVENLYFLSQHGVTVIPKTYSGTSSSEAILVEEFFQDSDYGFRVVNDYHAGKVSLKKFLKFQTKTLKLLTEIYNLGVTDKNQSQTSTVFDLRTKQRMDDLLQEQDSIYLKKEDLGSNIGISLRNLMHFPITLIHNGQEIQFGSLTEIVSDFIAKVKRLPKIEKRILHGDFHAPNIARDHLGNLHLIDLSDVMYGEDPSWDLGKWLNHVNRLYRVVLNRSAHTPAAEIIFSASEEAILIEDRSSLNPSLERINREAISLFANMIGAPSDLVAVRAAAAEFIVNVSTLRRHIKRFPSSTKAVVICILNSFQKFQERFQTYVAAHPKS